MENKRPAIVLALLVTTGAALVARSHHQHGHRAEAPVVAPAPPPPPSPLAEPADEERAYVFRLPTGEPTALSCDEARVIIEQVRLGLAYEPSAVEARAFATSAADWLDPHGLLSLAPDAPGAKILREAVPTLLASLEGQPGHEECAGLERPAARLKAWADELRATFAAGRAAGRATSPTPEEVLAAVSDAISSEGAGREVARELGRRVGVFEASRGDRARDLADAAERRFTPELDEDGWIRVILAAGVRAWVPTVDPHGEWAPFDEESRIYEIDLSSRPPRRLWGQTVSTALGARVTESPRAPLEKDDVVLEVAGVATAGLPLEQLEQLSFAADGAQAEIGVSVFRRGAIQELRVRRETVATPREEPATAALPIERVRYGDGDVLVVTIKDVRDDLGDDLGNVLAEAKSAARPTAVVLDLRGNGGGSTDGAVGALGLFLPGAPLFSLKRRDGTIEIDRAPSPRDEERWDGPVATLVDGATASAAEMIAGALATYRRGPSLGVTTFGKGCAQEYVDDDAHSGVLRLTTLVYALPDGSPVQRVGLKPTIHFPFAPSSRGPREREASLAHAAPPWRGQDVRDASKVQPGETVSFPPSDGRVGPCTHKDLCDALLALGRAPAPRWPPAGGRPPVARH